MYIRLEFKYLKQKLYRTFNIFLIFHVEPEICIKDEKFENKYLKINENFKLYKYLIFNSMLKNV
jgi:hypothetical protein